MGETEEKLMFQRRILWSFKNSIKGMSVFKVKTTLFRLRNQWTPCFFILEKIKRWRNLEEAQAQWKCGIDGVLEWKKLVSLWVLSVLPLQWRSKKQEIKFKRIFLQAYIQLILVRLFDFFLSLLFRFAFADLALLSRDTLPLCLLFVFSLQTSSLLSPKNLKVSFVIFRGMTQFGNPGSLQFS